jgi:hypothetical protein
MVDQRFKTVGVEVLLSHQIDQSARIEVAAARSHITSPPGVSPMLVAKD